MFCYTKTIQSKTGKNHPHISFTKTKQSFLNTKFRIKWKNLPYIYICLLFTFLVLFTNHRPFVILLPKPYMLLESKRIFSWSTSPNISLLKQTLSLCSNCVYFIGLELWNILWCFKYCFDKLWENCIYVNETTQVQPRFFLL